MKGTVLVTITIVAVSDSPQADRAALVQFAKGLTRQQQFDLLAEIHECTTQVGATEFVDVLGTMLQ